MSKPRAATPGRLTISLLHNPAVDLPSVIDRLTGVFGLPGNQLPPFPFDFTDYYQPEMGAVLFRSILSFREAVPREQLASIKLQTNQLETEWSGSSGRAVNLDPGLVTEENFLLATGKNFSHRVYLQQGIYADLTLIFQQGEFRPLPWTYADYRDDRIRNFLAEERRQLLVANRSSG
ncbi:DUF4416 family protein [bacterium]|nr:DUF4416 family protein [bacterium]